MKAQSQSQVAQRESSTPRAEPQVPQANRPWPHVPLGELFARAGNTLHARTGGDIRCGHEPRHSSRSGQCVALNEERGIWWCSSCRTGGGVVHAVMDLWGLSYPEAVVWLTREYGPSQNAKRRPGRRRSQSVAR
jgi:hypothetical protein